MIFVVVSVVIIVVYVVIVVVVVFAVNFLSYRFQKLGGRRIG